MRRFPVSFSSLLLLLCLAVGFTSQRACAQTNQTVYDDALVNGWQNWSWCAVDFSSTDAVHAGAYSAKVTYTGGYQGFYLHHANFDSSLYTAITFWINGGSVSGRNILVAGILNDVGQAGVPLNNYIAGGSVAANTWRQVTIPLSALHIDNNTHVTGFWLQDASGGAQAPFYVDDIQLIGAAPPNLVHINVNAGQNVRTVDARVFGLNTAIWDGAFNTAATISQLGAISPGVLRFPGGSQSDAYHWQTNTQDGQTWQWATNFDAFANVALALHSDAFITVNYGSGTPQEAANWVTYSNVTKRYGFHYWEIGNEVFGTWEYDTHTPAHDPYTYAVLAKDYITRMKAIDPTIKVGVVAAPGEDSYVNNTSHPATNPRTGVVHNGWTPVMLATLRALGCTPDFIIHHRYEQGPGSENDSYLLQSSQGWRNDAADLRQQLNDYLGAQAAQVELVCTENNSVFASPGKQSTSLVNGLFVADSIGNLLQTEFNALVWWDFHNGQEFNNNNDPSLYGWRQYGDYGIGNASGNNDLYPTYYVSKLLTHFARGGDKILTSGSDYNLLTSYAAKRADGTLSLMVINKSPSFPLNASIALTGYVPQPGATVYSYGIPQDEAAHTGIGSPDVAQTSIQNADTVFTATFAPYSVTILSLRPALPIPTGLTATPANASVSLSWNASSGATSYNIKRSTTTGGPYTTVGTSTTTSFTNTGLTNGTRYYYVVTAVNGTGESGNSNEASATPVAAGNSAAFVRTDTSTQGSWKTVYGNDGYNIIGDTGRYPAYATVGVSGNASWTWAASTSDVRGLQKVNSQTDRIASTWYTNYGSTETLNINLTDGQTHQFALYCIDWINAGCSQRIDVLDGDTNAVLNSQTVSAFSGGIYYVWNLKGHIKINITSTNSSLPCLISGLFFDPPGNSQPQIPPVPTGVLASSGNQSVTLNWNVSSGATSYNVKRSTTSGGPYTTVGSPTTTTFTDNNLTNGTRYYYVVSAVNNVGESANSSEVNAIPNAPSNSATFVRTDTSTQGSWKTVYGNDGYNIIGDTGRYPAYATVGVSGNASWTWAASTSDVRGLQKVNSQTDRIASTWYANPPAVITLDLRLTDNQTHPFALYCIDWVNAGCSQRIDVLDGDTNAVLNSQTVSAFSGGIYYVWNLKGHIKINITSTNSSLPCLISGIFFN